MNLHVSELSESQCQKICTWQYPAPYDIYNWPAWEQMIAAQMQFADPSIRHSQFAAVVRDKAENSIELERSNSKAPHEINENLELIGYVQFFPLEGVTRLGLGLRPDLCSQGLGIPFMKVILQEANLRNPKDEIDLEVHTWNERARKLYTKSGFVQTDEYMKMTPSGIGKYYCMVYSKKP